MWIVKTLFVIAPIVCQSFVFGFVFIFGLDALSSSVIILPRKRAGCFGLILLWLSVFFVASS